MLNLMKGNLCVTKRSRNRWYTGAGGNVWNNNSRIKNQPFSEVALSPMCRFFPILVSIWVSIPQHLYFSCWNFNYSFSESVFSQTKRPLSLTWHFHLLLWTKSLRRPGAAGWHLPSHLDSELLLQGTFSSSPECSELPRALLSNMVGTSYM